MKSLYDYAEQYCKSHDREINEYNVRMVLRRIESVWEASDIDDEIEAFEDHMMCNPITERVLLGALI